MTPAQPRKPYTSLEHQSATEGNEGNKEEENAGHDKMPRLVVLPSLCYLLLNDVWF